MDFTTIFRNYFTYVYIQIRSKGFSKEDAQDLAEDTFLILFRYLRNHNVMHNLRGLIDMTIMTAVNNFKRHNNAQKRIPQDLIDSIHKKSPSDNEDEYTFEIEYNDKDDFNVILNNITIYIDENCKLDAQGCTEENKLSEKECVIIFFKGRYGKNKPIMEILGISQYDIYQADFKIRRCIQCLNMKMTDFVPEEIIN